MHDTDGQLATEMTRNDLKRWFALHVNSRCDKQVAQIVEGKGYEQFAPTYRARRRWSDRFKDVELPLFPGYVFCRLDIRERLPVLKTPGVVRIVGMGNMPVPVEDYEIEAIQTAIRSGAYLEPWPSIPAGGRVRINFGSMSGLEGVLVEVKARHRLIISVGLLQRSVAVEIDRDWVSPLSQTRLHPLPIIA